MIARGKLYHAGITRPPARYDRMVVMMSGRWMRYVYITGALLVGAVLFFTIARPVVVLPRIRLAPGYVLQDQTAANISSEDARGKLTLYSFAYTGCKTDCAAIYDSLQAIDAAVAAQPPRSPALRFVTLTIDPQHDTPQTLQNFERPFTPAAVEWIWLTGSETWMRSVTGGAFEVLYQPQDDGSVFFAPRYILVDGVGVVRAIYDGAALDAGTFMQHLALLYKEIEQSGGASRLAYEAAHFFACYPQH